MTLDSSVSDQNHTAQDVSHDAETADILHHTNVIQNLFQRPREMYGGGEGILALYLSGFSCVYHSSIPYILESNPHPFYSFRGLKNQMRIRFAVVNWILEKWKRCCTCHRTIQYNNLLFYLLFIIYYTIFIIYYSSDSPSSLITESVCLVGKGRLKERCVLEPRTNLFFVGGISKN
jgi:hypothetical protein